MTIFELLQRETGPQAKRAFLAATLAGTSNALILGLANHAAEHQEETDMRLLGMFILSGLLYVLAARQTHHQTTKMVEEVLVRIKGRIARKVEGASAQGIERLGHAEVYDRITENSGMISDSAGQIANLMMSVLVLLAAAVYAFWISPEGAVFVALLLGSGMALFWNKRQVILDELQAASAKRLVFFDALTDLLRGFKETKFSRQRSKEVLGEVIEGSESLREITIRTHILFDDNYIFTNCVLFALLCVLTMILPQYIAFTPAKIGALTATVLFAWNPIAGIAGGLPAYLRSNVALDQIHALEAKLDAIASEASEGDEAKDPWQGRFATLELRRLAFKYEVEEGVGFEVGPIDLEVQAGEVVFVVGGNGSGKSTLFKALTGLYPLTGGELCLDGLRVEANNLHAYRELLSVIFSDFHLFKKVYGQLDADPREAARLLDLMQLRDKTEFNDAAFSTRQLSTGQRKRLAMIVALLEDRPLYAFDEWAADQDPEFREFFYRELIPMLVAQGKTVIAVSHDDRYFDCADILVRLDYGQVRTIERRERPAPLAPTPDQAPPTGLSPSSE